MEKSNFEKRLKAYQGGWLSPEEMAEVEAAIEKARAIQEYLFAEEFSGDQELEPSEVIDSQAIQKNIKRRFIKQGVIIGSVVLLSLLLLYFLGLPLVNSFFYNPLAGQTKYRPSDYELYLRAENYVYTEADILTGIFIEPKGLGKYEVNRSYFNPFSDNSRYVNLTINRNQLINSISNNNFFDAVNREMVSTTADFGGQKNDLIERKVAQINGLPGSAWIKVDINFGQSLSIEELEAFLEEEEIHNPLYTKVETVDEMAGIPYTNFGYRFNNRLTSTQLELGNKEKERLEKKYPNLFRTNLINSASDPKVVEEHFISALSYLIDHQGDLAKLESQAEEQTDFDLQREEALAYVKEHGVKIGRLVVAIPKGQFESVVKNDKISFIGVPEVNVYAPHLEPPIF